MKLRYLFIIGFIIVFFANCNFAFGQEQKTDIENKIKEYENKLVDLRSQKNTLASQIQYMDTQVYLTELQIEATEGKIEQTQKEIESLSTKIEGLDESLSYLSKLLINQVVEGYKKRTVSFFALFLDSGNAQDLFNRLQYLKTTQNNNQKTLIQVQKTKFNFEDQKKLREEKKTELAKLSETLDQQKNALAVQRNSKQKLLADTQNNETIYQNLLSQAQAQLAAFSKFVTSQGGASILSNQTVCDDWGCYYSQRDNQWGTNSLNGTGYSLASDGCLVTSMAMVYTHLGRKGVNPQTINSNSNNFASYYPAYLEYTITADGLTTSRISASIDSTLSSGDPVVVGVSAYGGMHFVVLISGSDGNYIMHDPFIENGHKLSFNNYYSVGSIFEIRKVVTQ